MIKKLIAALAAGIFMLTITGIVYATTITINTLTFTEVSAGVNITGGSGTGSKAAPIIFNEDVSGNDVTIKNRGLGQFYESGRTHVTGFFLPNAGKKRS